jgi:hypothetical protein
MAYTLGKNMVHYSTDNDARKPIYFGAAVIALGLSQLVRLIPAAWSLSAMAPSAMVIFGLVLVAYDKILWKWRIFQLVCRIPILHGKWTGTLTRPDVDGGTSEATRSVELIITQTWLRMALTFRGERSSSEARIVGIHCDDPQHVTLKWVYFARDEAGQTHENLYGEGTTHLTLHSDTEPNKLKGYYYSSKLRKGGIQVELNKESQ